MPLPNPSKKEEQNEFVSRCMSDGVMKSEFKNDKQRAAVCHSIFEKSTKSKGKEEELRWDDVKNDGFTLS